MVYKIVWTFNALQTYMENMRYLETAWTEKEVKKFALMVEKKVSVLLKQPGVGSPRNKKQQNISIFQSVLIMRDRVPEEHYGVRRDKI